MSPLQTLETSVEAMILAAEKSSQKQIKVMEGLEPIMEALTVAYVRGAKDIQTAVIGIKDYVDRIEPVKINQEAVTMLTKLNKVFSSKNLFTVPSPTVIQDSKETVKLLKDLIRAVDLKPLEVNVENDFTTIEKCLERIEKLVKFEIPLEDGRVAIKLSDADLKKLSEAINIPWQTMGGDATESTLSKIPGLSIPIHDRIDVSYTSTTDVFTYRNGGVTPVATVTITYTDSSKELISSVIKS